MTEAGTDISSGTGTSDCYKKVKGASKSNNDKTHEEIGQLQNMITADDNVSICANCGKEGSDVNNSCNKCKMVKYCNAACKKKHRHKHKKDCEEQLRHAAELHDVQLFKQPPPKEDCPICFLCMPTLETGYVYYSCCGKTICSGCDYAVSKIDEDEKCPFCRAPAPDSDEEMNKRRGERIKANDHVAIFNQGNYYRNGKYGLSQDITKAFEHWHRAGELGHAQSYCNIGYAYNNGLGVEVDEKKAMHYYELAAMDGSESARHNLAGNEVRAGNMDRSLKHYMIAVRGGHNKSLEMIQKIYTHGHATKENYTKALELYQAYLGEIKSLQRDEAAAAYDNEEYCYY